MLLSEPLQRQYGRRQVIRHMTELFFEDCFIVVRRTNVYMNFQLNLYQIPVYMKLIS
jgi:hypothetical protein